MHGAMETGGRIAIMGPELPLLRRRVLGLRRSLRRAHPRGDRRAPLRRRLRADRIIPRYLPYSFRGILPPSPALTRMYLKTPLAWRLLGKQFLVIGQKQAA